MDAYELAAKFTGHTSGTLYAQLDPKRIGEYARALQIGGKYGTMILTRYMGWSLERASKTLDRLISQYPSHGFVVDYEELINLELPAKLAEGNMSAIMNDLRGELVEASKKDITIIKFFGAKHEKTVTKSNGARNGKSALGKRLGKPALIGG